MSKAAVVVGILVVGLAVGVAVAASASSTKASKPANPVIPEPQGYNLRKDCKFFEVYDEPLALTWARTTSAAYKGPDWIGFVNAAILGKGCQDAFPAVPPAELLGNVLVKMERDAYLGRFVYLLTRAILQGGVAGGHLTRQAAELSLANQLFNFASMGGDTADLPTSLDD